MIVKDSGGGDYKPIPAGLHHGICYAVYETGTHWLEYQGQGKWVSLVLIVWELPEIRLQIEKDGSILNLPKALSREFTASLHPKATLRKILESWRNREFSKEELKKGFDLNKLLGVNCTLQVIHKETNNKTYANIANVLPLMDKSKKKEPENPTRHFSFAEDSVIPEGTPAWIQAKIENSKEWLDVYETEPRQEPDFTPPIEEYDDDIPF